MPESPNQKIVAIGDLAYASIAATSPDDIIVPDAEFEYWRQYEGTEAAVWEDLRRHLQAAKEGFTFVSTGGACFAFRGGSVQVVPLTGTAARALARATADLPRIELEAALSFIDACRGTKLRISSSLDFVHGVSQRNTVVHASIEVSGKWHKRVTVYGFLQRDYVDRLRRENAQAKFVTVPMKP